MLFTVVAVTVGVLLLKLPPGAAVLLGAIFWRRRIRYRRLTVADPADRDRVRSA
jgi:hypothetical protein